VGTTFLRANGIRDIGTELQQPYPTARRINFAYGAGASLGFQLTNSLSILAGANWDHLGRMQTGFNPDIGRGPEAFLVSQQLGLIRDPPYYFRFYHNTPLCMTETLQGSEFSNRTDSIAHSQIETF
jgi:hypothetical protein